MFPIGNLIERLVYDELVYSLSLSRKFYLNDFFFVITKNRLLERK